MIGIFQRGRKSKQKEWMLNKNQNIMVADFICPTPEASNLFPADYIIWVDTIEKEI